MIKNFPRHLRREHRMLDVKESSFLLSGLNSNFGNAKGSQMTVFVRDIKDSVCKDRTLPMDAANLLAFPELFSCPRIQGNM